MPHYLLSVSTDVDGTMPPPDVIERVMARVGAHQEELKAAGVWVFFAALAPPASATVVRAGDGTVSMTDGPFAEAKEHIGGFTIIEVEDLDAALDWARRGSEACGGLVEVRPIMYVPD